MTGDNRYTYGIVEDDDLDLDLSVEGVAGADAFSTVEYRSLAAVVSDIDVIEPEESDENVRAHDDVLREVMHAGDGRAVVPMRYGMVFSNDRALKHVLRNGRREFTSALRDVEGCEELGVRVLAPDDGVANPDGVREDIAAELDPHSVDVDEDDLFSDRLLLNRAYLVNQDDRGSFDDAIDAVRTQHEDLTVQYTGPWAPYSFVDIHVQAEG